MGNRPNGTPGKKPPAPSVTARPDGPTLILLLRKTRDYCRMKGIDASGRREDDYVVMDDQALVGRIYREIIHGELKWLWFLQTVPAPQPNRGRADTLEEAKAGFKNRYQEVKGKQ